MSIAERLIAGGWPAQTTRKSVDESSRGTGMLVELDLPQAFSVRDENEFFPVEHLIARLNPDLVVRQVATGMQNKSC